MLPVTVLAVVLDGWRAIGILAQPPLYGFLAARLPHTPHPERLVAIVLLLGQHGFGVTIALTGGPVSAYLPFVIPTALSVAPRLGPRAVNGARRTAAPRRGGGDVRHRLRRRRDRPGRGGALRAPLPRRRLGALQREGRGTRPRRRLLAPRVGLRRS